MEKEEKIQNIKDNVQCFFDSYRDNIKRFHKTRHQVYVDARDLEAQDSYRDREIPFMEYPILKPFVSKLVAEFISQDPSINAHSNMTDDSTVEKIKLIENVLRRIFFDAKNDLREAFEESVSGGYSVLEWGVKYKNEKNFDQSLFLKKVNDPTLCFFDIDSKLPNKSDGGYCGMIMVVERNALKHQLEIEGIPLQKINNVLKEEKKYNPRNKGDGFFASFVEYDKEKDAILVEYYEKVYETKKVFLAEIYNVVTEKMETKIVEKDQIEPGVTILDSRVVNNSYIKKTVICNDEILKEVDLEELSDLPLIFVTGDLKQIRCSKNHFKKVKEIPIPYIKSLIPLQNSKNLSFSLMCNDMQKTNDPTLLVGINSVPDDEKFQKRVQEMKKQSIMIYNDRSEDGQQNPPPVPLPRQETPNYLQNFMFENNLSQTAMGTYQQQLSNNLNQLSGKAIYNGSVEASNVSIPYFANFIECSIGHFSNMALKLFPSIFNMSQSVPVRLSNGKNDFEKIEPNHFNFLEDNSSLLDIQVSPGISKKLQKEQALTTLVNLISVPPLQDFISNTAEGIEMVLSNLDIDGIEELTNKVGKYMQEYEQKKQLEQQQQMMELQKLQIENESAQKAAQYENPLVLKEQELNLRAQKQQQDAMLKQKQLELDEKIKGMETMLQAAQLRIEQYIASLKEQEIITAREKMIGDLTISKQKVDQEGEKIRKETSESRNESLSIIKGL